MYLPWANLVDQHKGSVNMTCCWRTSCHNPVYITDDLGLCEECRDQLKDPAYSQPPTQAEQIPPEEPLRGSVGL
jgi:hypothetical protein